jgi:hypothetical protein
MTLALLVPAAYACNKEDKTQENIEVKTEAPPPAAPMTITIMPQGGATLTGDMTATRAADKTTVRVNLSALDEKKDYDAKIRYGDCTMAASFDGKNKAKPAPTTTTPAPGAAAPAPGMANPDHKAGDEVTDIHLDKTGATATGTADIDSGKLAAGEAAYIVLTSDDMIVGCADLTNSAAMGAPDTMGGAPGTAPGAAMPADTGKPAKK